MWLFYFHKVAYVHYLGEVDFFHSWAQKFLPLYNSAKIIKINRDFPKLWSQMYCHLFYGSQCTMYVDNDTHAVSVTVNYNTLPGVVCCCCRLLEKTSWWRDAMTSLAADECLTSSWRDAAADDDDDATAAGSQRNSHQHTTQDKLPTCLRLSQDWCGSFMTLLALYSHDDPDFQGTCSAKTQHGPIACAPITSRAVAALQTHGRTSLRCSYKRRCW